jgi:hypothetical protein
VSEPYLLDKAMAQTQELWSNHDGEDGARLLLHLAQNCIHRSGKLRPHATALIRKF